MAGAQTGEADRRCPGKTRGSARRMSDNGERDGALRGDKISPDCRREATTDETKVAAAAAGAGGQEARSCRTGRTRRTRRVLKV